MRGSLRLRHQEHCPAGVAGRTRDPRACRCGPTVQGRVAGIARTLGYLERGWRTGDLMVFEHRLAELRQQLLTGQAPEPTRVVTLAEYAEPWFERIAAQVELGRMSPLTYNKYEGDWRLHLKPAFGRLPLPAIGDQAITRFVSRKLHAGLSEATVKNSLIALSGMLTDAVADGLIPANPLRRPQRARHRGGSRHEGLDLQVVRRPPKHLEIAEALALLDAVHAEQVDMVLLALTTGFRRNEILGLQWEWIDFGSSRVHLQGQLFWRRVPNERRRQAAIVRCKYDSEREVPLFSGLAARLGPRRRATGAVFVDPRTGAPWRETAPAARFLEDAYERAGLRRPGRMWHQLRHTYASVLAAGGVKRHEVEQLMGHRSQGTTGLYTHLFRETYSDVEAVLNDTYGSWVHVRQDPRRAIGPHRADWGVADDVRARRF